MRKRPVRTPIRSLVAVIMLFEMLAFLLVALHPERQETEALQALGLALCMPALCWFSTLILPKFLHADRLLMALMNFLCGVGVVILFSMVPDRGVRQAMFYALGLVAMAVCILLVRHVRSWRALCWLIIPAGLALLVLPLAFGSWQNGAKNWVSVPWLGSFQPSEVVKLMLVVVLAYFFSAHRTFLQMMPAIVFTGGCLLLLMLQRDLGTALMYYFTALILFYAASGNVPLTVLAMGGGAGAAVVGYNMFAHVKVRVAMWRNPWSDALGSGYQIIQALLAIGSGGLLGVGLGLGEPRVIPAYYTDFVFAVICEQFGIAFGVCVVAVYVLIVLRGLSLALRARRSFLALLALGCAALLGVQTFVIIGGVIKLIPLTGITMPFISYGGTSMVSCMGLMGFLQGISSRVREDLAKDIEMTGAREEAGVS